MCLPPPHSHAQYPRNYCTPVLGLLAIRGDQRNDYL
jgi:hypothetical protein